MLPYKNRLTKKSDFENVRQSGKFVSNENFTVSFVKREDDSLPNRFGFIVSKKISTKAHERNKVKRILREIIAENIDSMKCGYDFVFIAKPGILATSSGKIRLQVSSFTKKF